MEATVSAILESMDGKLILQLRDNKPNIGNPGKVALFGGHQELNEDPASAIIRELEEELELKVAPSDLIPICVINGTIDGIFRTIYCVKNIDRKVLRLHEGQAIIDISKTDDLKAVNFATTTRAMLSMYWRDVQF